VQLDDKKNNTVIKDHHRITLITRMRFSSSKTNKFVKFVQLDDKKDFDDAVINTLHHPIPLITYRFILKRNQTISAIRVIR
jgi:hypothetical protein